MAYQAASQPSESADHDLNSGTTQSQNEPPPPLTARRLITTADIAGAIEEIASDTRSRNTFSLPGSALQHLKSTIALSDRVAYLDALTGLSREQVSDYEIAAALADALQSWRSPAVDSWCRRSLAKVIAERLPGFAIGLGYDSHSPLTTLLNLLPESRVTVPQVLIAGVATHIDELNVQTIYEIVLLLTERISPEQATRIVEIYLKRLVTRIPPGEIDRVVPADVPTSLTMAMGRFLFALLSDCDVRTRWRSAHVIRRLGRFGEAAAIDALRDLYVRTVETSFRAPHAPFYWLGARLWLLIAIDRVASENPAVLSERWRTRLFEIATDTGLPHVLIRDFAKDAARKLEHNKLLALTSDQHDALRKANVGALRRVKAKTCGYSRDSAQTEKEAERRFRFDPIDTIPYWYQPATAVFADVTLDEFASAAEHWIVDEWKVIGEVPYGKNEPRRHRFSDRDWGLWSNRHGSAPTIERYPTYLEWHAMWCAVGELMRTKPLVKAESYHDGYEEWLSSHKVAFPPHWRADLRGPKPLETRFWLPPSQGIDEWVNFAADEDFLREIGIGATRSGMLIVRASHETHSSAFVLETEVRTALVEPETAAALVRALQNGERTLQLQNSR